MTIFLTLLATLSSAHAGRNDDACASIKPEQQLAVEQQQALDGMLRVGVTGVGRGEGTLTTSSQATYDTRLLSDDHLARSWYVYQLCVMKQDGVISAALHDELMRELFGLQQASPAPALPLPGGPAAGGGCPWRTSDSADASASGVLINGQLWPIDTAEDRSALRDTLNACGRGEAAMHLATWTARLDQSKETNLLGQPTADAQRAAILLLRDKKKLLKALED